ncbi:sensor histidine kinase [Listeria fleischmannii]|uniref:histidine kinase n=1 Tax=Listeria fleischmannii TaxID=1069827 RepID=A0A841YH22_9LIST|nr:sensor histidine kinase [Listeria fleischmannii]EIA19933.1 sensor histidine kinase [Listeria fleischmannii subsp. coloradonensis]MBC1399444.1 HAMP domain-containing histidine kinase [Listeria fleischmannii]MBC1419271.1 HAMP domain-containing histidine kinase [Listeria fleischmannii]MBC1427828.1 HAMP domain-containing histidine kinase [Listeria fleischmannii]STY46645.1 Sensor histidine kinase graS [Listeria fleischmannii subsp. coloradonensis]
MTWWRYVRDKRFFLFFFVIVMFFVGLLIYIDPNSKLTVGNIVYLYFFVFMFLVAYLVLGYIFKYRYWKEMKELVEGEIDENIIELLPNPRTSEQAFFNELMRKKHREEQKNISALQDKQEEYHDFILYWVHEVKTPLVASKMLIKNPDLNDTKTIFAKVDEELDRVDQLVMQALYFSRLDTFAKDYFIQEQNLGNVVRESIKRHSKLFISGRKKLVMEEVDFDVRTDSKWLGFILDQIISNALKYTEEGDEIKIWCEEKKDKIDLYIRDQGRGISDEDLSRVFEQGFTGMIGRKEKKATGMGLYLAKQMAKKLGHTIEISSVEGEFTELIIHFARKDDYLLVAKDIEIK